MWRSLFISGLGTELSSQPAPREQYKSLRRPGQGLLSAGSKHRGALLSFLLCYWLPSDCGAGVCWPLQAFCRSFVFKKCLLSPQIFQCLFSKSTSKSFYFESLCPVVREVQKSVTSDALRCLLVTLVTTGGHVWAALTLHSYQKKISLFLTGQIKTKV